MLEVLTSIDEGGPSGTLRRKVRRAAVRRDRSAPPQKRCGADDGRGGTVGGGTDRELTVGPGRGDDPGRAAPRGRAGGDLRVVLGERHPGRVRRGHAPGPPAGGEGVRVPAGEERSARRGRSGGSAADGSAARGV